jgi:hypothetical protein
LLYNFSQKKEIQFENNEFLIVKVVLERGGSNYDNVENACNVAVMKMVFLLKINVNLSRNSTKPAIFTNVC